MTSVNQSNQRVNNFLEILGGASALFSPWSPSLACPASNHTLVKECFYRHNNSYDRKASSRSGNPWMVKCSALAPRTRALVRVGQLLGTDSTPRRVLYFDDLLRDASHVMPKIVVTDPKPVD